MSLQTNCGQQSWTPGWTARSPLVLACGEHAMPVPLAETLGAHALAGAAGLAVPEGAASFAVLRGRGAHDGPDAPDAASGNVPALEFHWA
ncbi:MAG TPA: hypothetical protein PK177_22400, partial [Burkholderiaceae bacterium]|nr:hypothetical protein [Burkholderiaceae bacterium]